MSGVLVVLVDDDGGSTTVRCPDEATAERLATAATMSPGGISAFRVDDSPAAFDQRMLHRLRNAWPLEEVVAQ